MKTTFERALTVLQLLALGLWAGGLATLGAIVAPVVFRFVPAPHAADAMTVVFARFDRVAVACGIVAVTTEALLWLRARRASRGPVHVVRAMALLFAALIAVTMAFWVTPTIAGLHAHGALRGIGEAGHALETFHHSAESLSKGELLVLCVALALRAMGSAPVRRTETAK
jgi:hypothetical protein